jgi:hypothetical protein
MRRHKHLTIAMLGLGLLLGSLGITGMLTPALAEEPAVFSCTSAAGQVGDNVEIQVSLANVTAMTGGAFNLTYDPQLVEPLQVKTGDFLDGYIAIPNPEYNDNGSQAVRMVWAKANGSSGSGVLCTINFKLLKSGQASLEFSGGELKNTKKQDIPYTSTGGSITITGGASEDSDNSNDQTASGSTGSSTGGGKKPVYNGYQQSVTGKADNPTSPSPGISTAEPTIAEQPAALTDIQQHWARDYIEKLTARGVLQGYADGTFKPDQSISRAEFTLMLARALELPLDENASGNFQDWDTTPAWAKGGISAAVKAGIIKGYDDGTFRAGQLINRAEMAVMIINAMEQKPPASNTEFTDNAAIPDWARTAVAQGVQAGLITGKGNNLFQPADQATRAESACMLARLLKL